MSKRFCIYCMLVLLLITVGCTSIHKKEEKEKIADLITTLKLGVTRIFAKEEIRTPLLTESGWADPGRTVQIWEVSNIRQIDLSELSNSLNCSLVFEVNPNEEPSLPLSSKEFRDLLILEAQAKGADLLLVFTSIIEEGKLVDFSTQVPDRDALYPPRSQVYYEEQRFSLSTDDNLVTKNRKRKIRSLSTVETYALLVDCNTEEVICTISVNPVTPENKVERDKRTYVEFDRFASLRKILSENWITILQNYVSKRELNIQTEFDTQPVAGGDATR